MGIEQIYERTIKPLPVEERLRLARLILADISAEAGVDFSEKWSDDDLRDLCRDVATHRQPGSGGWLVLVTASGED